jgi:hypothetical protein
MFIRMCYRGPDGHCLGFLIYFFKIKSLAERASRHVVQYEMCKGTYQYQCDFVTGGSTSGLCSQGVKCKFSQVSHVDLHYTKQRYPNNRFIFTLNYIAALNFWTPYQACLSSQKFVFSPC